MKVNVNEIITMIHDDVDELANEYSQLGTDHYQAHIRETNLTQRRTLLDFAEKLMVKYDVDYKENSQT